MWVDTRAGKNDHTARSAVYAGISVHNSVNEELAKMGWHEVNDNHDALISFDILVERSTELMDYARLTEEEISRSVRNIFNKFDMVSR
jgi:hypothetical protein